MPYVGSDEEAFLWTLAAKSLRFHGEHEAADRALQEAERAADLSRLRGAGQRQRITPLHTRAVAAA